MCQAVPSAHHPAASDLSPPRKWVGPLCPYRWKSKAQGRKTTWPRSHRCCVGWHQDHVQTAWPPGTLCLFGEQLQPQSFASFPRRFDSLLCRTGDWGLFVCASLHPCSTSHRLAHLRGARSLKGSSLCIDTCWRKFMWRRMHHKTSGPDSKFSGSSEKTGEQLPTASGRRWGSSWAWETGLV